MTSTVFYDKKSPIYADWLNDVNDHVYHGKNFSSTSFVNVKDPTYGALGDGTTDDTTAIQAAITAVAALGGGIVFMPAGTYKLSSALSFSSPNIHLWGAGRKATKIRQDTLSAKIANISNEYITISDMSLEYPSAASAGGVGIYSTHFYGVFHNLYIKNAYYAWHFTTGSNTNMLSNVSAEDFVKTGIYANGNAVNILVTNFALLCSNTTLGADGCIRLLDQVEGCSFTNGQTYKGAYALFTSASSYTMGNRPAYNKFNSVFFDSAANGVVVDKAVEVDFNNCWFSNRPSNGATLTNCSGIRFNGGGAVNCALHGILVENTATQISFTNFSARGNSTTTSNTYDGIHFAAGCTDFIVQNCTTGGDTVIGFGSQRYGIRVDTGASDRYVISSNLVSGNSTGGVSDLGTGTNKLVTGNF